MSDAKKHFLLLKAHIFSVIYAYGLDRLRDPIQRTILGLRNLWLNDETKITADCYQPGSNIALQTIFYFLN